jgi:hypothetical protein
MEMLVCSVQQGESLWGAGGITNMVAISLGQEWPETAETARRHKPGHSNRRRNRLCIKLQETLHADNCT